MHPDGCILLGGATPPGPEGTRGGEDGKWSGDGGAPNVGGAPGMASAYCLRFPAIQVSPGFELVVREDHHKTRAARGPARS